MRNALALIVPSLAVLAASAPALGQTQAQSAAGLELFDYPNLQGPSVRVEREVANLGPGAFDNLATSVHVTGGAWELCDGPNFTGSCETIDQDVWDLERLGLNNRVSSIRPASPYAGSPYPGGGDQDPYPGYGGQPTLVLYEGLNYRGRSETFTGGSGNLRYDGFDDRARSLQVTGEWTLCEGPNLTGRCERIDRDVPDLGRIAMSGSISSFSPETPSYPSPGPGYRGQYPDPYPGGGGPQMLEGERAGFYPSPPIQPGRLTLCLRGNARACEEEVDTFCRAQQGNWREGAYYSIDARAGRLNDILCVR